MEKKKVVKRIQETRKPVSRTGNIANILKRLVKSEKQETEVKNDEEQSTGTSDENGGQKKNKKKHNREITEQTQDDMGSDSEKLNKIKNVLNKTGEEIPEVKVQIEKKDKGLFERTSESTVLLTEDNKVLLTD